MQTVVGPILMKQGCYAFDLWTPEEGLSRGFAYRRVEEAHYAHNVEIRSRRQARLEPAIACTTVDEFVRTASDAACDPSRHCRPGTKLAPDPPLWPWSKEPSRPAKAGAVCSSAFTPPGKPMVLRGQWPPGPRCAGFCASAASVCSGFSDISSAAKRKESSAFGWLPFLDTYRTMCLAPEPEFRRLLDGVRELSVAA